MVPSEDITITNNGGNPTYTFTENGGFTYEFTDEVGNTGAVTATVDWIDKTPPTATFAYSTMDPTNQNVVASLVPSEPMTITNNGGNSTYIFIENGSFIFDFVDTVGNTGTGTATVDWIDKNPPTATVNYSSTDPTNSDVVASLVPSEAITVTNNGGFTSYTFTENGSFIFEFADPAGNTGTTIATVDWIDKTPPTTTVNYSSTSPTNSDVVASLVPSEAITVTNNGGFTSYTFTENGSFTFEFADPAGNTGTTIATVDWIDKTDPTATFSYSTADPTNSDVTVTLDPSETIFVTNNDGLNSYTFTANSNFTFEFIDPAGNTGTATAIVDWIDKMAPTGTVSYSTTDPTNLDVVVTVEPSEPVTVTNNGGFVTYTFTENGSFTFEFADPAGNTGAATATVDWIDKIAPTATFSYSTT